MLILVFSTACIETDVYIPGLPAMLSYFETTELKIELLLSLNFFGLAVSALIYGPLSDAYGRRPIALIGLSIFTISSLICFFTSSIDVMIVARVMQGLGSGSVFAVFPAALFDRFPETKAAKVIAVLNSFVTAAMAFAPILGSWLILQFGWRACFALIAVLATVCILNILFSFKETLSEKKRSVFNGKTLMLNYWSLTKSKRYMFPLIINALVYSCIMVFMSNASLIYINGMGMSESIYGYYQASVMSCFVIGSLGMIKVIDLVGIERTKYCGYGVFLLGTLLLGVVTLVAPMSPFWITFSVDLFTLGSAVCMNIYYTDGVGAFPDIKGCANAMANALRLGVAGVIIGISGQFHTGGIQTITIIIELCVLLSTILAVSLWAGKVRVVEAEELGA